MLHTLIQVLSAPAYAYTPVRNGQRALFRGIRDEFVKHHRYRLYLGSAEHRVLKLIGQSVFVKSSLKASSAITTIPALARERRP